MLDANLEGAGDVNATVQGIIDRVRSEGDTALLDYTRQFDRLDLNQASELEIPKAELFKALEQIDPTQRDALEQAQNASMTMLRSSQCSLGSTPMRWAMS